MDINNKQELIAELEKFHKAKTRVEELENYTENIMPQENREAIKKKKSEYGSLGKIPTIFDVTINFFEFDVDKLNQAKKTFKEFEKIFYIALGVTGVLMLIYFTSHVNIFNTLSVLGIFASIFLGKKHFNNKKTVKKLETEYDNLIKKYNESVTRFNNALQVYEKEKQAGIEAAREYGKKYREYYAEAEKILESYLNKIEDIIREQFDLCNYMQTFDLVDESYYHLIPRIVANLRSSRADTLKEALNIAIDEERQEQYEAQRRYEEEQRALREQMRLEAEQAEIRRHNLEMEIQAAAQARAAQDAARASEKAAEVARKQAEEARYEAKRAHEKQVSAENNQLKICGRCAHYGRCGGGVVGCGSFTPKY